MSTARIEALRKKVQSSVKVSAEAKKRNELLKGQLKEKEQELQEVLALKQETLHMLKEDPYAEENARLEAEIEEKEGAIIQEMANIEKLIGGEEEEFEPTPKPEKNGKPTPPEGGAKWFSLEGDDDVTLQEEGGKYFLSDEEIPRKHWPRVEFWGPLMGVGDDPDEASHYRIVTD